MVDLNDAAFPKNRDNIESHKKIFVLLRPRINLCGADDFPALPFIHEFLRQAVIIRAAGFYFHETEGLILLGNQVHFAAQDPEISFQDFVTVFLKVSGRGALAAWPDGNSFFFHYFKGTRFSTIFMFNRANSWRTGS